MTFQKNVNGVDYTYEESFWTGKKKLSMNGVPLTPVSRREFRYLDQGGAERRISVKGNFLGGITLLYEGGSVELLKNKWYEWVLIFVPLLGFLVGIFGGAIGGGLSAVFCLGAAFINATILRSKLNLVLKILFTVLVAVGMNVAWFLILGLIAGGLALAFPGLFA